MSEINSLRFLRAVYLDANLPLTVRMRAAIAALPHEVPRLMVTAQVAENDFATLLEQRIKNYQRIIEAQPLPMPPSTVVEAKPMKPQAQNGNKVTIETKPNGGIEIRPPKPHVVDRRFRRM